ncbi:hypothetical protein F4809DRAFT_355030 [Biscogniauxia mediterranea]|nr:hypothetical protein F4809DRAFT_355030 [Biscogniauxia mediterranea]
MYTARALVAVLLAMSATTVTSASIHRRQLLDGLKCNVARLRIVGALGDTQDAVADIQDPTVQQAASTALDQAQGGIAQIAKAIFAGEAPPQDGRDQVEAGLTAAGDALGSAGSNSTDTAVADAQSSLADAVQAGKDVVANC